jgi:thiamine transport system permease protein
VNSPRLWKEWRQKSRHLLWIIPCVFLTLFFFTPLVNVLTIMFSKAGRLSFDAVLHPLWFTIWQAFLSTILTLVLGIPAAYLFSHYSFKGKRALRVLTTLPFILPTVVVAAGFNTLLGPKGWLNQGAMQLFSVSTPPINFTNTIGAIFLAHVFYNISVIIRVMGNAWTTLDPKVEDAAKVLGASPFAVLRRISLPLLRPSLLAAGLMVFLFDFTSFGVILLLGGPKFSTLETAIYTETLSMLNLPMAGLLSVIQLACTFFVTGLYTKINSQRMIPILPKLGRGIEKKPTRFGEKVFATLIIVLLCLLIISPLVALALQSFIVTDPGTGTLGLSLRYYNELFINRQQSYFYVPPIQAALNSLVFAVETVLIAVSIGAMTSYALVNIPRARKWMDTMIMLPLGASAVTLGLGFLITFNRPPLDVAGFPLLIPIAHSLVAFPFVVRAIQPALAVIPNSLKEAAAVLGASPWKVWWHVEAPIISRAALVGGIFSFAISLGEFGATSFLARPEMPTLPVAIYRFLSQPGAMNYGQALAMATILLIVCAFAISLLDRIQLPGNMDI